MFVADYRFRAHGHQNEQLLFADENGGSKISLFSAFSLLLHVSLTTDYLRFGTWFSGGIVQTIIITVVPVVLTQLSFHVFFRTWVFGSAFSYSGIWVLVFGPMFSFLPSLLVVIAFLDFPFNITARVPFALQTIIEENWPSAPHFLVNKWVLIYVVNCVFVLPFLVVRRFSSFRFVSYIGNLAFIVALICLTLAVSRINHETFVGPPMPAFGGNVDHAAALFSIVNTAFFMHPVVEFVTEHMNKPTNGRTCGLVWMVCIVQLALLNFIGIVTYYYYFGVDDSSAYFSDLMDQTLVETMVLRITFAFKELLTNGCYIWMMANLLTTILVPANESQFCIFIMGFAFLLLAIAISFTTSRVRAVICVVTSIAKVILVQILPPVYYLGLFKFKEKRWASLSMILLICGLIASLLILHDAIRACTNAFTGIYTSPPTGTQPIGDFADDL